MQLTPFFFSFYVRTQFWRRIRIEGGAWRRDMVEIAKFERQSTKGYLHTPAESRAEALVLTHGAGGNCQAPLLIAVAGAFAGAGFLVLRCDLPFRQRRAAGPPVPGQAAEDRRGLKAALDEMRQAVSGRVFLGGHSYGGRQASMLAAEEPEIAAALLLLSYPLHPPKKQEQMRSAHFRDLQVPSFFVHGVKDPFGSPAEMHDALPLIPARTRLVLIEGAGHDLARGKFDLHSLVVKPFAAFTAPGKPE